MDIKAELNATLNVQDATHVPDEVYVEFELKYALAVGGTGEAYPMIWSPTAGAYVKNEDVVINVKDFLGLGFFGAIGDRGISRRRWTVDGPVYDIIEMEFLSILVPFELKDDLTPGGNATAYVMTFNGSYSPSAIEMEVYDELGIWRGRAKDKYGSPHDQGSRGYAWLMNASGHWAVVQMQQHALMIRGALTSDLVTTDATFTIDGVHIMQPIGGIVTDHDPAGNTTVHNIFSWEGSNNGVCIAVWNENEDRWEALQVECP